MQQDAETLAKPRLLFPFFPDLFSMSTLHLVVVSGDDCFFAREVIVGGPGSDLGSASDVAHGGGLEAATAKELERGVQDQFPSVFGFRLGRQNHRITRRLEHVQILSKFRGSVK